MILKLTILLTQLGMPQLPEQPKLNDVVHDLLMYFIAVLIAAICVLGIVIGILYTSNKKDKKEAQELQSATLEAFKTLNDGIIPIGSNLNDVKQVASDTNSKVSTTHTIVLERLPKKL